MTARRLDPAVVTERLREIQLLLADLAGSINIHIVTSLLGRSPDSYAASFDEIARAGVLE